MKKETVICAMLATATCATAQNGKFPTSGVSADSVQTEKDSIKADKEAEIQAVTVTGHRPMYKMRNDDPGYPCPQYTFGKGADAGRCIEAHTRHETNLRWKLWK